MLESTELLNNSKKVIIIKDLELGKKPGNKTNLGKMEVEMEKEKLKRVITNTKQWNFSESDLEPMNQLNLIKQIMDIVNGIGQYNSINVDLTINDFDINLQHKIVFIKQQINNKIYGYRNQDLLKSKYDGTKFVDFAKILEMMLANDLKCYYCNNPVLVLYEYVREPRQWTVERIDNKFGHNKDNIEIACLNCNLHRRTMHHERYLFTKNLSIVKR